MPSEQVQLIYNVLDPVVDRGPTCVGGQSTECVAVQPPEPSTSEGLCDGPQKSVDTALSPPSCPRVGLCQLTGSPLWARSSRLPEDQHSLDTPLPAHHNAPDKVGCGRDQDLSRISVTDQPPPSSIKGTGHEAVGHREAGDVPAVSTAGAGEEAALNQGCEGPPSVGPNRGSSEQTSSSPVLCRAPTKEPPTDHMHSLGVPDKEVVLSAHSTPLPADNTSWGHPNELTGCQAIVPLNGCGPTSPDASATPVEFEGRDAPQELSSGAPVKGCLSSSPGFCVSEPFSTQAAGIGLPTGGSQGALVSLGLEPERLTSPEKAAGGSEHGQAALPKSGLGAAVSPIAVGVANCNGPSTSHNIHGMQSPGQPQLAGPESVLMAPLPVEAATPDLPFEEDEAAQSLVLLQASDEGETAAAQSLVLLGQGGEAHPSQPVALATSNFGAGLPWQTTASTLRRPRTRVGRPRYVTQAKPPVALATSNPDAGPGPQTGAPTPGRQRTRAGPPGHVTRGNPPVVLATSNPNGGPGPQTTAPSLQRQKTRAGRPAHVTRAISQVALATSSPDAGPGLQTTAPTLGRQRTRAGRPAYVSHANPPVVLSTSNSDASPGPQTTAPTPERQKTRAERPAHVTPASPPVAMATSNHDAGPGPQTSALTMGRRKTRAGWPAHVTRAGRAQKKQAPVAAAQLLRSSRSKALQRSVEKLPCQPHGHTRQGSVLRSSGRNRVEARHCGAHRSVELSACGSPPAQTVGKKRKQRIEANSPSQPAEDPVQLPPGGKRACSADSDHPDSACDNHKDPGATADIASVTVGTQLRVQPAEVQKRLSAKSAARGKRRTIGADPNKDVAALNPLPSDDDMGIIVPVEVEPLAQDLGTKDNWRTSLAGEGISVPVEMEPPVGGIPVPVTIEAGVANATAAAHPSSRYAVADMVKSLNFRKRHPLFAVHSPQAPGYCGPLPCNHKSRTLFARRSAALRHPAEGKGRQMRCPSRTRIALLPSASIPPPGVKNVVSDTRNRGSLMQPKGSSLEGQQPMHSPACLSRRGRIPGI